MIAKDDGKRPADIRYRPIKLILRKIWMGSDKQDFLTYAELFDGGSTVALKDEITHTW